VEGEDCTRRNVAEKVLGKVFEMRKQVERWGFLGSSFFLYPLQDHPYPMRVDLL
jgi:hypothetical protein